MNELQAFSIPLKGIGSTAHQFDFQVDDSFFALFEDTIIDSGSFQVHLELDKRTNVIDLEFSIEGNFKSPCDRCLREIDCFVQEQYQMKAQYGEDKEEQDEIIYIPPAAHEFNVAKVIYELIGVSLPISKVCEGEEERKCDDLVEQYLGVEDSNEDENISNPFKDLLKDFDD